jgi:hypothetical protein
MKANKNNRQLWRKNALSFIGEFISIRKLYSPHSIKNIFLPAVIPQFKREQWWLIREQWWIVREQWWLNREQLWLIGSDTRL